MIRMNQSSTKSTFKDTYNVNAKCLTIQDEFRKSEVRNGIYRYQQLTSEQLIQLLCKNEQLLTLDISNNIITSFIFSQNTIFTNLLGIDFSFNNLTKCPDLNQHMPHLVELHLRNNQITNLEN